MGLSLLGSAIAAGRRIPGALLEPGTRHALAETAIVKEIAFQAAYLLIEQIVGLVDETDRDVRDDLGRTSFAELLVLSVGHIWVGSEAPNELGFPTVLLPLGKRPCSEEIMIVIQQLFETRARGIRQFDLYLC